MIATELETISFAKTVADAGTVTRKRVRETQIGENHEQDQFDRHAKVAEKILTMKYLLLLASLFASLPVQAESSGYAEKTRIMCNAEINNGHDPCGYLYYYSMAIATCELSNAGLLSLEGKLWTRQHILSPYNWETAPQYIREALTKTESEGCSLSN